MKNEVIFLNIHNEKTARLWQTIARFGIGRIEVRVTYGPINSRLRYSLKVPTDI